MVAFTLDQNLRSKTEIFAQAPQLYVGDREKVSGSSHWEWWKTLQWSRAAYLSKLIFGNVIMTESNRKLSNFYSPWTKTLYQNNLKNIAFFFYIFQGSKRYLVICNNTKDYFSKEPKKMNVKFHKNCESTGKIPKISCARCHFVKFDIRFLELQ